MISLLIRFLIIVMLAIAFAWLADQPGDLTLRWLGYEIQTSVMAAAITVVFIGLVMWLVWSVLLWVLDRPGAMGSWFRSRRQKKGHDAVSAGLIAVAAGDREAAQAHARTAVAVLGDDPMAKLLDAQAAQLRGDGARVRQLFDEMAQQPETRLLGLRGLHTEAVRQQDMGRARELAEQAARINPKLQWASQAVLTYQSASQDWPAIRQTIDEQKRARLIDRSEANARHAVVLTAQAHKLEAADPARAGELALEAHKLEPSLVPAAVMAARSQASAGNLRRASKIIEKTWALTPHPDLADAYAHVRAGDSAQDRLARVAGLVKKSGGIEGAVALARAAIEAHEWKQARKALEPYAHDRPQARVCGLMAEIEEGEFGDKGRSREWLARAVRAPRDPAWTADGFISRAWLPVSPVSGELGGFRWRVPVEGIAHADAEPEASIAKEEVLPGDDAIQVTPETEADIETAPEAEEHDEAGATGTESAGPPGAKTLADAPPEHEAEHDRDGSEQRAGKAESDELVSAAPKGEASLESGQAQAGEAGMETIRPRQPDDPGPETSEKKPEKAWL
jgi:HemY protein